MERVSGDADARRDVKLESHGDQGNRLLEGWEPLPCAPLKVQGRLLGNLPKLARKRSEIRVGQSEAADTHGTPSDSLNSIVG